MRTNKNRQAVLWIPLLLLAASCSSDADERLGQLAHQSLENQAKQNEQMARQSQQVTEASRDLVAADATARKEMIEAHGTLQQQLQTERSDLDRQHEDLERDRRETAATRNRDPIVAGAIITVGVLLACALPILLCFFVVRALSQENPDDAVGNLLVQELVADDPLVLPANFATAPAIEHQPALPTLPAECDPDEL